MNFFSIDCSTDLSSLFLKIKNKTFIKNLQSDKSKSDLLMKEILDFFKQNDVSFNDITHIFVNQGPGNFSGLRSSLAIAKGISLSKNLNLLGYDTFKWAGAKFFNKKNIFFCIIKFREKYYIKKFDIKFKGISEIEEVSEDDILKKHDKDLKVVPNNMVKYFSQSILKLNNLHIAKLDHNNLEFLHLEDLLDNNLIKPLYLG
tara:strand:- start:101 stop:706 length:606 start_codon:yes stop_codon:yes gene_type:complete